MKKFILILGGARSGKSTYAVELAKRFNKKTAFVATLINPDNEMRKRIKRHKLSRPRSWAMIEEGMDLGSTLFKLKNKYKVVLVDCLGLVISNMLDLDLSDLEIEYKIKKIISHIFKNELIVILVSNDVGSGIVPANPLARRFRDLLGLANQRMAKKADEVIFMQSGIPLVIKRKGLCKN